MFTCIGFFPGSFQFTAHHSLPADHPCAWFRFWAQAGGRSFAGNRAQRRPLKSLRRVFASRAALLAWQVRSRGLPGRIQKWASRS